MHVLYQPAGSPGDWLSVDASDWGGLPPDPIHAVNVQGVVFEGDHYAVEVLAPDGCRVTCWNDDPTDWTEGQFQATVAEFRFLAPDPKVGDLYNTRQTFTIYYGAEFLAVEGMSASVRPWSEFVIPPARVTRHGISLTDADYETAKEARAVRGWREWTDGVPVDHVDDDGKVFG